MVGANAAPWSKADTALTEKDHHGTGVGMAHPGLWLWKSTVSKIVDKLAGRNFGPQHRRDSSARISQSHHQGVRGQFKAGRCLCEPS